MRECLNKFIADQSGVFAVMAGILMVPLLIAIGLMVDYVNVSRIRAELQDAADAAAIGAVAISSPGFQAAGEMEQDGPIDVGVADAVRLFQAQVSAGLRDDVSKLDARVTKSGATVTAVVKFEAHVPTNFVHIAGFDSVAVNGVASAQNGTPAFSDFYLLLDNTPSMGLGATQKDIDTMVNNTRDKCAFACHETRNSHNYYRLAKKLGVTMRIDVMRDAIEQMMDTADETNTYKNQFRFALYHFGKKAEKAGLYRIAKLTSNTKLVRNKARSQIDLMTIPYQNYKNDQLTNFNTALSRLERQIGRAGTGLSSSSRLKNLFLVTDGVADYYNPRGCQKKTTRGRCQEPVNTAYCDALKKRGVRIAVLYTTYYPLPTNSWYRTWIAPFRKEIGGNLKSCASQDLYFEVSPTEGIAEAMNALFQKIISQPRIVK